MTRPLGESSVHKKLAAQRKGIESLARRPGTKGAAVLFIKVTGDRTTDPALAIGDGQFIIPVSQDMGGMNLTRVEMAVTTVSTSGKPTVQLRNITQAVDMLTTKVEVDANEKNSKDAATQVVIDLANDDVAWGDHVAIDVDVAGTGTKGLTMMLTFALP